MGSRGTGTINKQSVTYEDIQRTPVDASVSFEKVVDVVPKNGGRPTFGKHKDTEELLKDYNTIKVDVYKTKAGQNAMKRLNDLGFKAIKEFKNPGTSITSKDWYIFKR